MLVGATGLIGSQLLDLLLSDKQYDRVLAVTRKPLEKSNSRLINVVVDFDKLDKESGLKADDVFCCLGTTIKKVKTQEAFRKVDYEYPLQVARLTHENGARHFSLVSALGANAKSSIFYNRVKGETEDAISHLNFRSLHIFRPSLLLGSRSESRSGEDAAKTFYKIFGFLIPKKYKGIDSLKIAKAMLAYARNEEPGIFFHESAELQNF